MTLPSILVIGTTVIFLLWERLFPGRELPPSKGWYLRVVLVNGAQLLITLSTARVWIKLFDVSLFHFSTWNMPLAEGFVGWVIGTFFFYWWHVIRHKKGWWLVFHQIHHSPSRIEALTSFYKHPVEIISDSLLSALVLYPLLGCSMMGAFWYNFFAATGEYFYHANLRTPRWLRYFIQTPELHSIHHQYNVHKYNFADLPLWDRMFGTYKDTTEFAKRCGFPRGAEERLVEMLTFKDVYRKKAVQLSAPTDDLAPLDRR
jgi:sterol desaturase/sphingolipid hydroxylase (fatty acid hydroxylase superfamily)